MNYQDRPISPEWVVPRRDDSGLDDRMTGGWGVRRAPLLRGASYTDFSEHAIAVPFGDTDADKAVQLHEMLHAALSPAEVPGELLDLIGVSKQAIVLAEELRINLIGASMPNDKIIGGSTVHLCDGSELASTDRICATGAWNDAVNLFISTHNTEMFRKVKRRLRRVKHWREPLAEIEKHLANHGYTIGRLGATHRVDRARSTYPELYRWVDRKGNDQTTVLNHGFISSNLPIAMAIDHWLANPPMGGTKSGDDRKKKSRDMVPESDEWQDLRIGVTRLTESTASFIGRRKRPAMTGKHPSRPDRLLTDPERRIFRETVRTAGGVVVFDCSGSMGVTHDVVRETVKQFAGATVMVYSDSSYHHAGQPNAWVVARNNRMISQADFDDLPLHSGNGVDGPALRWAIRNKRTRKDFLLWVSDGQVTGRGDHHTDALLREVSLLSKQHNIIGVDTCEEAVELLRRMKNAGTHPRNRYCRAVTNFLNKKAKR